MSVIDAARDAIRGDQRAVPRDVQERLERGRRHMRRHLYRRRLCALYLKGEQFRFIDAKGRLTGLETRPGAGGRPLHRLRNVYNVIEPLVDAKVSGSTTRVPGYEVNPSSTDPEDEAAARLSQKVIAQGWTRWNLKDARIKAVTTAVGCGGSAYALPYFDPQVGPFRAITDAEGNLEMVGEGEIKVLVLNGNQCYWEPGVDFADSRWHACEVARPIDEIMQRPGYLGGKLEPDASTADTPSDAPSQNMAVVTFYFERPCPKYPEGRMMTFAGGQVIERPHDYPLRQNGQVIDEPCIHRLVYKLDPKDDDDLGLTWPLIDFQASFNDAMNKSMQLKNLALLAQMMAQKGTVSPEDMATDEPGSTVWYRGSQPPTWRPPPDPAILAQLQQIVDKILDLMRFVAADTDVQAQPNVAMATVQAVVQQAANRWSQFLSHLAEWDSAVARSCLLLAQQHYSEERVLKVRGRFGWEPEASFRGADIKGQVDVYVNPASVETRSRQSMLQTLGWIQANFPGYVRPEVAIEIALHGQSLDTVIEGFELDKARANEIIQRIRDGTIMQMPSTPAMDPATGMPLLGSPDPVTGEQTVREMPSWMPRPFDNVDVQAWVFEQWLKTPDASSLPPELYDVAMNVYQGYKYLQAQQRAQEAAAQTMQAQQLGEANAAKPQERPMPSTPNPAGEGR